MSYNKTIAALEIGTGKMQVFIGELLDDGRTLRFIGSGQATSYGLKKGDINEPRKAAVAAQSAIVQAERISQVQVEKVCMGITGTHIKGFRNIGSATVSRADGIISQEDVERAKEDARSRALPDGKSYIHRICCGFYVDNKFSVNPIGQSGSRVDAEYWMLYGDDDKIAEAIHVVQSFGLEVEHLVFSGLASALAVTTSEQKEKGALVIDIGCGTTDYIFYKYGRPMQAGTIPIGGDHITNDLYLGIRLPQSQAEKIKIHCGKATITEDEKAEKFWSFGDKQIGDKKVPMEAINKVIRMRLEELFLLLREDLIEFINDGIIDEVIITGGTSKLSGICELASAVLELPCSLGKFSQTLELKLREPEFATSIGLLEYARIQETKNSKPKSITGKIADFFKL